MFYKLENGLSVYLFLKKNLPLVSITMVYGVGSFDESKQEQGVAHFLEHMMFKGSKNYSLGAIDLFSHVSGGENNAYTCKDYTAYYHLLPKDSWQEALLIEKDRMINLDLKQGEFDSEKQVVIEELKMYQDEPQEILYDSMYESLYSKSGGYFHPVLGYEKTLDDMSLEIMQGFYDKYYNPSNATLILIGDFDISSAKETIKKELSKFPSKKIARSTNIRTYDLSDRKLIKEMEVEYPNLQIGFPSCGFSTKNYALSNVLDEYLSGGKICRFYQILCEENDLVNNVQSFCDSQVEGGAFFFNFELKDIKDSSKVLTLIYQELNKMLEGAFNKEEFEIAKTKALSNFYMEQEKLDDYTMSLIPFTFYSKNGEALSEYQSLEGLFKDITESDMKSFVCEYFKPSMQVLGIVKDAEDEIPNIFLWEDMK
ncbi:MAG: hypothetical protein COB02_06075 [Candidatus Cloacimonadota bacterium]|nr:MAG: hypothetical protein COB02_12010 [Candidatus Cloacimonadota bacterium]PCJ20166.1 MAG: hypothetical protein COB02_06075 [Candidatus Cloacimonadota bacterium]